MKKALPVVIGIILISVIILYVGPKNIVDIVERADIIYLGASTLFLLLMHLVMGMRVKYLISLSNGGVSLADAFKAHMMGMILSDFTPGRSGYFMAPAYLKVKGIDGHKALFGIMAPQPFDLVAKIIGGLLGILLISNIYIPTQYLALGVVLLIGMLGFLILLLVSKSFLMYVKHFTNRIFGKLWIREYAIKLINSVEKMQRYGRRVKRYALTICGFVLITYMLRVLNWYYAALAFNIKLYNGFLGMLVFFLIQPLVSIIDFLPLPSAAGTGFSELGMVSVLGAFGISSANAVAYALLIRIQSIIVDTIGIQPLLETVTKRKNILS